ncbi:MAG: MBL fold metallo-hydrolase [Methylobacterium mesophilicum]|nr:MBL fold metallo-hydrolase [Methylobacterium mesophilicum]
MSQKPESLAFDRDFEPAHGTAIPLAENVLRLTANNESPFTFTGTNSYIVGTDTLAVIDPGPEGDERHYAALLRAIAGRPVSHIFVSHTHRDHSPLARRLKQETGALLVAEGPHRIFRPLALNETNALDASADHEFLPDHALADGEVVSGDGWALRAVLTPGHCANHACFALDGTGILFSADHVMAWATTIVAPPDGAMAPFMASLDKLLARDDRIYLPGHGGPVRNPQKFVRGIRSHRKLRERAILARIEKGDRTIPEIVRAIYAGTDPRLHGAAGLSVFAHLEDLAGRGRVVSDGPLTVDAVFRPA